MFLSAYSDPATISAPVGIGPCLCIPSIIGEFVSFLCKRFLLLNLLFGGGGGGGVEGGIVPCIWSTAS